MSGLLVVCLLLPSPEREGERVKGQSEKSGEEEGEPALSLERGVCECKKRVFWRRGKTE